MSKRNYRIRNVRGKVSVVHVNRLKQAYKQGIWKERGQERCYSKQRIRRQEPVADESAILAPGTISIPAPQDDRRQPSPGTPNRSLPRQIDTPASAPQFLDAPGSQRLDPNYVPPDTPRSRRELGTTRLQPPITRLQSRLQALPEAPETTNTARMQLS